jgi:hypothetical protein
MRAVIALALVGLLVAVQGAKVDESECEGARRSDPPLAHRARAAR